MRTLALPIAGTLLFTACSKIESSKTTSLNNLAVTADTLPPPYATPSVSKNAKVIPWPANKKPIAPVNFTVTKYASGLNYPRWIYQAPNGDVFVAEARTGSNSANRITILRDANRDGTPELKQTFLQGLNRPLGMLILNGKFYVANTDGVLQFPYTNGQTTMTAVGKKILTLPAGGYNNHWTRNIIANAAGSRIYVSVGSAGNVGEFGMDVEARRAAILEINPDGTGERIYASGIRNPVGMAWAPVTNVLWTSVNERDLLGDNLVPDYMVGLRPGGWYGWPYAYFGTHEDPRWAGKRPDLVASSLMPDVDLGSHTSSLGLAFHTLRYFPGKYQGGAFVGQHGSWNRSAFSGYKVVFVPFASGKPTGRPQDFLTGFIANSATNEVYGRPAGVCMTKDGAMLVADDAGNTIWRVEYTPPTGNKPPVARAGDDYTVPLSWNYSPVLNATPSTDADGWIKSFLWTKVSGPTTCTIVSPNAGQTKVNFTATGTYVFRVTVTDNLNLASTDDKTIVVTP